jgi:hypothetical protein
MGRQFGSSKPQPLKCFVSSIEAEEACRVSRFRLLSSNVASRQPVPRAGRGGRQAAARGYVAEIQISTDAGIRPVTWSELARGGRHLITTTESELGRAISGDTEGLNVYRTTSKKHPVKGRSDHFC